MVVQSQPGLCRLKKNDHKKQQTVIADSELRIVPQRLALKVSLSRHRQQRHSYVRNRRQSLPAPLTHSLLPRTNPSQLDHNVHHQMKLLNQTAPKSAFLWPSESPTTPAVWTTLWYLGNLPGANKNLNLNNDGTHEHRSGRTHLSTRVTVYAHLGTEQWPVKCS